MKVETTPEETRASLDDAQVKSDQLEHQVIATRMKQKVKEEIEKEEEMFKRSTQSDILARQKDELEVSVCALHIDFYIVAPPPTT